MKIYESIGSESARALSMNPAVSHAATTFSSNLPQPPPAPPLELGPGANTTSGGGFAYNYPIAYVSAGFTLTQIGFEVKTWSCAPVSAVIGIEILAGSGGVVAWELNSSTWGGGVSTIVTTGDS
ncbi:MAG: hypothetical protein WAN87_00515, partial [Thermoplasmata archaeon]